MVIEYVKITFANITGINGTFPSYALITVSGECCFLLVLNLYKNMSEVSHIGIF